MWWYVISTYINKYQTSKTTYLRTELFCSVCIVRFQYSRRTRPTSPWLVNIGGSNCGIRFPRDASCSGVRDKPTSSATSCTQSLPSICGMFWVCVAPCAASYSQPALPGVSRGLAQLPSEFHPALRVPFPVARFPASTSWPLICAPLRKHLLRQTSRFSSPHARCSSSVAHTFQLGFASVYYTELAHNIASS